MENENALRLLQKQKDPAYQSHTLPDDECIGNKKQDVQLERRLSAEFLQEQETQAESPVKDYLERAESESEEDKTDDLYPQMTQIRNDLSAFAQSYIDNWDSYVKDEIKSNKYGFPFVARKTEYSGQVLIITKTFISGCTLEHYARYREKYNELTHKIDEKVSFVDCPDF